MQKFNIETLYTYYFIHTFVCLRTINDDNVVVKNIQHHFQLFETDVRYLKDITVNLAVHVLVLVE